MPVIGTAGHVDHGKSTLVRALTGRDPDRWAEEKVRGLTIDLGFAWTTLPSGVEVGFVDVPGHERFIKNMLAGVDAITVALFVVAADEGWMPQSEEHLSILDLLGIDRGIVALTRADLVDADTLEIATLEVDDRLRGTSLEGAPIIPTAAPAGQGVDEVRSALDNALAAATVRDLGRPRLWVDRSFTIAGAGTVVTGTLVDGPIALGESLALFPEGVTGRIRSIQSHERSLDRLGPGNRAAVNITGVERAAVGRGAMLGRDGDWFLTRRFTAEASTVRLLDSPLRERGSFHLHVGSGAHPARIRLLEGETLAGNGSMIIEVDEPLALRWGDRFILREVGRQAVVAGGRVLDPDPPRRRKAAAATVDTLRAVSSPDDAANAFLDFRGVSSLDALAAQSGGGRPRDAIQNRDRAYASSYVAHLTTRTIAMVDAFHAANPLRPGIPRASLAEQLGVDAGDLGPLLSGTADLETVGAAIRRAGHGAELETGDQAAWEAAYSTLRDSGFGPPRRSELGLDREVEHALVRDQRLVEVSADLFYLPETLDAIVERTAAIGDGFTVAQFRDALGITRKHAIPLLEWLDARGFTVRDGDLRRVRP